MTKEQRRKHILRIAEMLIELLDSFDEPESKSVTREKLPVPQPQRASEPPKIMSEIEFCKAVGISRHSAWQERKAGRLPYIRVGGKIKYLPRHVEAYLNRLERNKQSEE